VSSYQGRIYIPEREFLLGDLKCHWQQNIPISSASIPRMVKEESIPQPLSQNKEGLQ
jgi:hypothetical protein